MQWFKQWLDRKNILAGVLLVLIYGAVQGLISSGNLSIYYQLNLILMMINIILAVSLNLINGFTGQFSLGHAGFMSVGAYTAAVLTLKLGQPYFLALVAGALAAAFMGFVIGIPTLRLRGDYLAIATLGFGEILRVVLINIDYVGGAAGITGIPRYTTWTVAFWMMVLTVLVIKNLVNSSYGRACVAVREDEIAAETMGINVTYYKVLAFAVGAFFAGIAGGLYAHYFFIIQPATFGFFKSIDILLMVVIGGLGSITGSILAAVVLTAVSAFLQEFAAVRMIVYALVLILMMIFRPQGLLGTRELSWRRIWPEGGNGGAYPADKKAN